MRNDVFDVMGKKDGERQGEGDLFSFNFRNVVGVYTGDGNETEGGVLNYLVEFFSPRESRFDRRISYFSFLTCHLILDKDDGCTETFLHLILSYGSYLFPQSSNASTHETVCLLHSMMIAGKLSHGTGTVHLDQARSVRHPPVPF